jgi:hypothetical protein
MFELIPPLRAGRRDYLIQYLIFYLITGSTASTALSESLKMLNLMSRDLLVF